MGHFSRGARGVALTAAVHERCRNGGRTCQLVDLAIGGSRHSNGFHGDRFSFIQPLLRGGGRDVIMERLTLAERTLLYNVRAFERYRTGSIRLSLLGVTQKLAQLDEVACLVVRGSKGLRG